jgi:Tol biopolymer transport system component
MVKYVSLISPILATTLLMSCLGFANFGCLLSLPAGPAGPVGVRGPTGDPGPDGLSCWDFDADRLGDPVEDVNGDGDFNALDCGGAVGRTCWDLNGDGISDPEEDTNADGTFDSLDCQGIDGQDGNDGPGGVSCWDLNGNGLGDAGEDVNSDGNLDSLDCQGPPGPDDPTAPPAPEMLRVLPKIGTPPEFELHWTMPASPVAIQFLTVHESDASFADPSDALTVASVSGSAQFAVIRLFPNSGVRYFRVQATSFTGVEGGLSLDYSVDTASRISLIADIDFDDIFELYVTDAAAGQPPVGVSGPIIAGGAVTDLSWSPDAARLAFRADRETNEVFELYVAPADGSAEPAKISGPLVSGGDVFKFSWSPNATRVAFIAQKDTVGRNELYIAPGDGSVEPVKVSGTLESGGLTDFSWSPDGSQLAFRGAKDTSGALELFVTPSDGSAEPTKVSGALISGGDVDEFSWSPNGTRVAFLADRDIDEISELYVALPDGSADPFKVSGTLVTDGEVQPGFTWSPEGTRLAFRADKDTDAIFELYVAPADASTTPVKVSGTLTPNGGVGNGSWSPNGKRLAFRADKETDGVFEVYVVSPAGGGEPTKVSGTLVSGGSVVPDPIWSPDATRLAFRADKETDGVFELFVSPAEGGTEPVKVSGSLIPGGSVVQSFGFSWSPDGSRLAFRADKEIDDVTELYVTFADGVEEATKVSGTIGADRDVISGFAWSPLSN